MQSLQTDKLICILFREMTVSQFMLVDLSRQISFVGDVGFNGFIQLVSSFLPLPGYSRNLFLFFSLSAIVPVY